MVQIWVMRMGVDHKIVAMLVCMWFGLRIAWRMAVRVVFIMPVGMLMLHGLVMVGMLVAFG
jgi:hypothetical protein